MKITRHLVTLADGRRFWFADRARAARFADRHDGATYGGEMVMPDDALPPVLQR